MVFFIVKNNTQILNQIKLKKTTAKFIIKYESMFI